MTYFGHLCFKWRSYPKCFVTTQCVR